MTDAAMDIWLDSAQYDGETLATLRENLVQAFNLPAKPGRRFNQWQLSQNQTVMHH